MLHAIKPLINILRAAREARKLSQRELAAKIGLPQSHLSKIESAQVNIKLGSFLELARTLDYEVMLIPRQDVLLVESILKRGTDEARPAYTLDEDDNA